jgi:flavin-dependent dehydrogenase
MAENRMLYDCAVIGGGLSGLCLAIQLADAGFEVILFEKNSYPFNKVCGEYISMESWDFLCRLGLPLPDMNLPHIKQLGISSQKGFMLNHQLGMGGFGISRLSLDYKLSILASEKGVKILNGCRVTGVNRISDLHSEILTSLGAFRSKIVCGSYGKYSPAFMEEGKRPGPNYIGVKYHIKADMPADRIELHNFENGYCGVSKVDSDLYCLCYLSMSSNLLANGKDIKRMEEAVLYKNPFLYNIFTKSEFVQTQPLVISNITFSKKKTSNNGIFLLGDAAGAITPLCGNGMSMGMRASQCLAIELIRCLKGQQNKLVAAANYDHLWNSQFNTRIMAGYYLQHLFGKTTTTDLTLRLLDNLPRLTSKLVSLTHGTRF